MYDDKDAKATAVLYCTNMRDKLGVAHLKRKTTAQRDDMDWRHTEQKKWNEIKGETASDRLKVCRNLLAAQAEWFQ